MAANNYEMDSSKSGQPNYPTSYPQPGYGQPQTGVQYQPQQQQPVVFVANRPYINFTGAIIFSCIVYWCCGWLFGLIAFILAMVGQSQAANGETEAAKCNLKASYILSIVGLVVGVIIIIVLIVLGVTGYLYVCTRTINGVTYRC